MPLSGLYGLVLSGGKSTRMGRDKGLIDYNGKPQREYLFELLSVYADTVFTSCNASQDLPKHLNPLVDQFDLHSPLNGILSALKKAPDKAWLVVAVDMPNVDVHVLKNLMSQRDTTKIATCFFNRETSLPEPLLTIWEPSALQPLLTFVEGGKVSPRDFLSSHPVKMIHPEDGSILLNINSPDDLKPSGRSAT
jgi:molybdenum cofactor guanylyltransferase